MKEFIKKVFWLVANSISAFFPYLFIFWLICLMLAWLVPSWSAYFYWPAFYGSLLMFGLVALVTDSWLRRALFKILRLVRSFYVLIRGLFGRNFIGSGVYSWGKVCSLVGQLIGRYSLLLLGVVKNCFVGLIGAVAGFLIKLLKSLTLKIGIKLGVIFIVALIAILGNIGWILIVVLIFACILVFFMDNRISAYAMMCMLFFCAILLLFNRNQLAEQFAVYTYYFLVVSTVNQLIEIGSKK